MNIDFAKVCGKHSAVYEAYYKQIDPKGTGAIEAMTAAKFLKKSGLSDVVLSRVWDLSDPNGKGFLDKPGFFVALKLVSLAQAGQVSNMNNIYMETANPPKVGEIPKILPARIQTVPVTSGGVANGDWSISVIDRLKYEQLFESLKPVGGMLAGNKVKGVLMDSKLPMETLGQIWDLADQDKDGNLDKHEFIVAMHLVYQTLQKRTVPNVLPPELRKAAGPGGPPPKPAPPVVAAPMPRAPSGEGFGDNGFVANFPKDIAPPPAIPPLPVAVPPMTRIPPVGAVASQPLVQTDPLIPIGAPPSVTANADWVVTPAELQRFEATFRDSDSDKDGLVSGLEVKDVFIKSGVPQKCLAHIWALCDTNQSGKLTVEQFALAMWMVERKQRGIEPPQVLTANMVPPSMRSIVSGVDLQPQEPKPTYSNPELEMISKEIEELARERRVLETEIAQKEADVRIKNGEVRSLQSELDTLSATLKQLEHQRGEAQKRLDDLQAQGNEYQAMLTNLNLDISQTRIQVNKIREQCHKQEETINEQEGELNAKRSELQKLKDEENALQKEYDENNRELTKLTKHLQNTQLQISSVRSMVTELMETQRQMTDALLICRAAIDNQNAELVSEYQLKIEPDFDDARKTLVKEIEIPKSDPFEDATGAAVTDNAANRKTTNGFDSDPFTAKTNTITSGFDDSFNTTTSGFDNTFDAFGNSSGFGQQNKDPFGGNAFAATKINAVTPEPGKDDFGSDPFAALHAPTGQGQVLSPNTQKSGPPPRPESPSPALPPKKSKVPPPRPAPPRPNQGPARSTQPTTDAFGSATSGSGSGTFADFADFDNKLTTIPSSLSKSPAPSSTLQTLVDNLTLFESSHTHTNIVTDTKPTTTNTNISTNALSLTSPLALALATTTTTTTSSSLPTTLKLSPTSLSSLAATATAKTTTTNITNETTTPTSIKTTVNNQLSRSNTPMQTAASSLFDTLTSTGSGSSNTTSAFDAFGGSNNNIIPKTVISGPTDFKDDPFKDYRYEDPFNIKDPFADDDIGGNVGFIDANKVFEDDFSSEDETILKSNIKNNNNNPVLQNDSELISAATPLKNEFLQKFDAFNVNPSPVPSQHSHTSSVTKKSQSNTPITAFIESDNATGAALFDAFADFDAFDATTKSTTTSGSLKKSITVIDNNANQQNNDSFYDAFNDNFNITKPLGTTSINKKNANNKKQQFDAFDTFSTSTTTKTKATTSNDKLFDAFNDINFEDEFAKTKQQQNNRNTSSALDNFTKFDAFDEHNFSTDFSTETLNNSINLNGKEKSTTSAMPGAANISLTKVQNVTALLVKQTNASALEASNVKVPDKFASDYSRPDTFDADLEEALKRSMLEN